MNMNTLPPVDRRKLSDYMLSTAVPVDPLAPIETMLPQIERAIDTMDPGDMTALLAEMRMKQRPDAMHQFSYDPCGSK